MPDKLAQHLPNVNATERAELFGSITSIAALPYDDPTRQGVIAGESPSLPSLSIYLAYPRQEQTADTPLPFLLVRVLQRTAT